jgi:hypothetical protein
MSSPSPSTTIDNEKLQQFMTKILSDFGGAASSVLVYIGDNEFSCFEYIGYTNEKSHNNC